MHNQLYSGVNNKNIQGNIICGIYWDWLQQVAINV